MHGATQMFCKKVEMHFIVRELLLALTLELSSGVYLKRVGRGKKKEEASQLLQLQPPALAEDRKCLAARCHIIPACTVLLRSVLCILSPREMEGRGAKHRSSRRHVRLKEKKSLLFFCFSSHFLGGAKLYSNCAGEAGVIASLCPLSPQVRVQKVFSKQRR